MHIHRFVIGIFVAGLIPISVDNAWANFTYSAKVVPPETRTGSTSSNHAFPIVVGFGNHIPLAFALRQIVPHGVLVACNFSIAQHTMVTWQGGVPWNAALLQAIGTTGLSVKITPVLVRVSLNPGRVK